MGCRPCARIILFTFNFLFFICGVLLLAFGIVGVADPHALTRFLNGIPGVENTSVIINIPETIVGSAVFMIILGSVILVFGFLGCAGAWCMVKWMLFIYWFVLILVLLAEIALIIVAAVSPAKVEGHVKEVLYKSLDEKFTPVTFSGSNITLPSNVVAVAWISLQFEVSCCGANNYTDYSTFTWNNTIWVDGESIVAVVPPSCCELKTLHQVPTSTSAFKDLKQCLRGQGSYNTAGCYKNATELMVQYSYAPIIIAAIVIFIELVAIATAVYLWKSNDKKKELV
jgi:hypothetical protein